MHDDGMQVRGGPERWMGAGIKPESLSWLVAIVARVWHMQAWVWPWDGALLHSALDGSALRTRPAASRARGQSVMRCARLPAAVPALLCLPMSPLDPSPCSPLLPSSSAQVVANPSALFLSDRNLAPTVSSAVAVVLEGTRPMLMEVQALCSSVPKDSGQPPMRMPSGVNRQRLALLLAVLGKHTDMRPYSVDVHLNVTGGESCAATCKLLLSTPVSNRSCVTPFWGHWHHSPCCLPAASLHAHAHPTSPLIWASWYCGGRRAGNE